MTRIILPIVLVLTMVGFGPSAATALDAQRTRIPDPNGETSACAFTGSGQRLACFHVNADGDANASGWLCAYDDAIGIFGWGLGGELTCVETTDDWGYVSGPGVCERTLGIDEPHTCVNGKDQCLLWVMSVRVVCHASEPDG